MKLKLGATVTRNATGLSKFSYERPGRRLECGWYSRNTLAGAKVAGAEPVPHLALSAMTYPNRD